MKKNKHKKVTEELAAAFIKQADERYGKEGELEVDTPGGGEALANVSFAGEDVSDLKENGGMYVKAWIWVRNDELPEKIKEKYDLQDDEDKYRL